MNTIVYLIRHSEPFKMHKGVEKVKEDILFSNIKSPLSINGEKLAEKISLKDEFKDINDVWSSNYVRAMSTAKYFAYNNNLKVNVDERFGERIHGCINSYSELPKNFEINQLKDETMKMHAGESQIEVRNRMFDGLLDVLNNNKGKRVVIVSHSTAIIFLLLKWCKLDLDCETNKYKLLFNNETIFEKDFDYCEVFKLEFDFDNNLKSIKNI